MKKIQINNMNILSINKYYWHKGGSETVFFGEKEMLENKGHVIVPFSMKSSQNYYSPYEKYFVNNIDYNEPGFLKKVSNSAKIIYSFEARNKIESLLKDFSPDLAHFHIFQHQISPSVFGPLKKKNIPIVLTLHDLKPICPIYTMYVNGGVCEDCFGGKFYNCIKNKCTKGSIVGSVVNSMEMYFHQAMKYYKDVDMFIAVSKFYRNKMIEFGYNENKILYLPNFIKGISNIRKKCDKDYILYFGRLSEEKGIEVLLKSAKTLPDIPFYIAGTGPIEANLKVYKEQHGLDNVTFLGFKSGVDLEALISCATCIVVPSMWYENCPMTVLEALSYGKPVIGSDIGGIPELINNNVDGFIFSTGDDNNLSSKIRILWERREFAKKMGLEGMKKVQEKFNIEDHYSGLLSIYESVISNKYG